MSDKPHISVVIPVYGCGECLKLLYQRLEKVLLTMDPNFEVIFINDKSPDNSWYEIMDLARNNFHVKGIDFSRNFGQHYAITAGFDYAKGDWVVVMDCDLQDQPEEIPKLYNMALKGYDIVYGVSEFRGKRSVVSKILRMAYFKVYDLFAKNDFKTENLSFYIISKNVKDNVVLFREQSRHISSLLRNASFKIIGVDVDHKEREFGKSSYTFSKRLELALIGIVAYSSTLLRFSLYVGFIFSFLSISFGIYTLFRRFFMRDPVPGWTSLVILLSLSTGLILCVLGIIGIYLEKIYLESKQRPLYLIKELINIETK